MTELDSDEDLTKELQPLAYHVSDRKRVLQEALRALKGKRLDAMIPPVLKAWNRPKLESACIGILEDLDDETLLSILDGRAATAGVAAVEQGSSPAKEAKSKTKKKLKKVKDADNEDDLEDSEPKKKKKKKVLSTEENQSEAKAAKIKKKKKLAKAKTKEKLKKKKKAAATASTAQEDTTEAAPAPAPAPHKSLMELLELEYRAKAIKALLRSQGQSVPDIPINIEGEDSQEKVAPQDASLEEEKTLKSTAEVKVNGSPNKKPVVSTTAKSAKTTTVKSKESKTASTESRQKPATKPTSSETKVIVKTKKPEIIQPKSEKAVGNGKKESQGAVINLIDEALSTSFSQIDNLPEMNPEPLPPSSVIVEACASKNSESEETLRSKLLKKYQNQQKEPENCILISKKKKKKRKKVEVLKEPEEDDILDLHPQELCLTDDDRGLSQTSENDSSDCETEEDEDEEVTKNEVGPTSELMEAEASQESCPISLKADSINSDKEQNEMLLDNEEGSEGDDDGHQKQVEEVAQKESNEDSDKSDEAEDKLWQDVHVHKDTADEDCKDEEIIKSDIETSANEEKCESEGNSMEKVEPISDNSRSGMFSESARDDMFETFTNSKRTTGATTFAASLKRKITLRIDPARIGVLEAKAAEEEARKLEEIKQKEEEQKRQEEERIKQEEEERIANEVEMEEGEYDSNEDADEQNRKSPSPKEFDLRTKLNKKREAELTRQRKSPLRRPSHSENSNSSNDSTAYYSRQRSPYKKRTKSPQRDFGKYSPKKPETSSPEKKQSTSPEKKRPASPVEFISQFSDMEPVSDDSDHSQSSSPMQKRIPVGTKPTELANDGPVHGCEERPKAPEPAESSDTDEDHNQDASAEPVPEEKASEDTEEDEDELPKPNTWYERWAESHGMKKVVQTKKIHKKVRTKLKQVKSSKKVEPEVPKPPEPSVEAEPIIGSIEEYEKLFGKKVVVCKEDDSSNSHDVDKSNDKEEEDDDGDDDLWGDILGS